MLMWCDLKIADFYYNKTYDDGDENDEKLQVTNMIAIIEYY